jgi:hypothetical protein
MEKKKGDQNEFLKERHFSRRRNKIQLSCSNVKPACDDLFFLHHDVVYFFEEF